MSELEIATAKKNLTKEGSLREFSHRFASPDQLRLAKDPDIKNLTSAIQLIETSCKNYISFIRKNIPETLLSRNQFIEILNELKKDLTTIKSIEDDLADAAMFKQSIERRNRHHTLIIPEGTLATKEEVLNA